MAYLPRLTLTLLLPAALLACDDKPPPAPAYYDRVIQPILSGTCVRNQGNCHTEDGNGGALGNLDLTSYEAVTRRRDVLRAYGSFPEPLLLLKGAGPSTTIPYKPGKGDGKTAFLPSQIQHAGGAGIARNSDAFFELQKWLGIGATRDGAPADQLLDTTGHGGCAADFATARPDLAARFNVGTVDVNDPSYVAYVRDVAPILQKNCALGSCHSSPQSDFFLACDDGDGIKFNFLEVRSFVVTPADTSEFLLRPLAPASGGLSHTGGVFFLSKTDDRYQKILKWATDVGPPTDVAMRTAGRKFFDEQVMPVMLQRGCALEACHSPGAANDFKLRPGSQGYFSSSAIGRNYDEARRNFLDVNVPDIRQSRVVKKPIRRRTDGGVGTPHRGGPVLESPGDPVGLDPALCPAPWTVDSTPFCTFVEWHRLERLELVASGAVSDLVGGSTFPVVYVERPADQARLVDFDTYHPGADLVIADATVGALGAVTGIARRGSLLAAAGCPGTTGTRDIRHPDVDFDGSRVVFAMRTAMADTLDLYLVDINGTGCTKITDGNGGMRNGLPVHNFDPLFAPTTPSSIIFASTRGRSDVGPTRSLKYLGVQSDLWRMVGTGSTFGAPEQLTSLLGSELGPAMMGNGQVSFTAEKATADFYQLAGRRINWDGTDYHPLLAQRSLSLGFDPGIYNNGLALEALPEHTSVGYQRATEIHEGIDRNFVFIASDDSVPGAGGVLATFNRSIGPFEEDRKDGSFLASVEFIDGDGRTGKGAYRSPVQLPDGRYLASYTADTAVGSYDLVFVNPAGVGSKRSVAIGCGNVACVEAALGYKRERKPLFNNYAQLVFGGRVDPADRMYGVVTYPDLPMLATLLTSNLRTGRSVDPMRRGTQVAIFVHQPPTDLASGMAGQTGAQKVYDKRMPLGTAKLAMDGSVKVRLPSLTPLIVELQDDQGKPVFTMTEEDQLGPGEHISRGVPERFFNSVCGGCHGSVSGRELDIAITPDALTGASLSLARDSNASPLGP